ncbi:unnamed protein product [Brachionus calyciflorus]|uniref:Uncharacterized protein n=1 Tax=Brachionus calyciflorus TaxID=104777 RepID=A0A814FGN0_9BILA|nr:unnamed protein product [Brachionus calyciflorus]
MIQALYNDNNYDAENFHDDDDSDTIATTVTTYTNITNTNNANEDKLLIGSLLYEQINSKDTALQEDIALQRSN